MSDGYKMEPLYEGAVMEVKANTIYRGGEQVCNLVAQHGLKAVEKDQKAFMDMIKAYLKRTVIYLKENGKADEIPKFKA